MPEIDFAQPYSPMNCSPAYEVQVSDFLAALREVEPSAIREVFVEVPNVDWDDVGGLDDMKERLQGGRGVAPVVSRPV